MEMVSQTLKQLLPKHERIRKDCTLNLATAQQLAEAEERHSLGRFK